MWKLSQERKLWLWKRTLVAWWVSWFSMIWTGSYGYIVTLILGWVIIWWVTMETLNLMKREKDERESRAVSDQQQEPDQRSL